LRQPIVHSGRFDTMRKTTMMLLFALQLPAGDPVRVRAVETLTARLAEQLQERLAAEGGAAGWERRRR
jgi:hypothetical protein